MKRDKWYSFLVFFCLVEYLFLKNILIAVGNHFYENAPQLDNDVGQKTSQNSVL